jgi:uncharacterized phage protein (TIGR02218 family)
MTYAALDTSVDAGAPYELFEFVEGSRAWRYTTSPSTDTWGGQQWLPRPVMREAVVRDSTSIGDPLVLTLPDNDPLALELLAGMSAHLVTVKIRQLHRGDADTQARVLFTGMVSGVSFQGAEAKVSCGSRYSLTSKRRIAPTTYQAACNLTWGSSRCGVNPETYRVDTTATASDQVGRTLTLTSLASYPEGHFNGGSVVLNSARRFIEKHEWSGSALTLDLAARLTLSYPFGGLTSTPTAISVYPNCQKTEADCTNRYNNLVNYLGWTRLPSVNPYNRSAFYLEDAVTVAPPAGSTGDLPGYPGYQIVLAPQPVSFGNLKDTNTTMTLEFRSNGTTALRFQVWRYAPGGFNSETESTEAPGWYLAEDTTLPVPGMWASPLPLPGYGDVSFRVDLAATTDGLTLSGFSQWLDPSPSVVLAAAGVYPNGVWTFTVRVRNRTSGLVIAQGDLVLTFDPDPVEDPHG